MKRSIFLLLCIFSMLCHARTQPIHVPSDQPDIQAGIDAASEGDTVLVADGHYKENINFKGKAITVASLFILDGDTAHISHTIIDGSQPAHPDTASTVLMVSGEDSTSVLTGFTISGGNGTKFIDGEVEELTYGGGGIFIYASGGKIELNIIEENHLDRPGSSTICFGGGLYGMVTDSLSLLIRNNTFRNNTISAFITYGGGLCLGGGKIICENNLIEGNRLRAVDWGQGGGLRWVGDHREGTIQEAHIRNNLIRNNSHHSQSGGGAGGGMDLVWGFEEEFPRVYNNIIQYNSSNNVGGGILTLNFRGMIYNNTVLDNTAAYAGNNLVAAYGNEMFIFNNIFWRKVTSTREGVSFFDTDPKLCHVYNNLVREALPLVGFTGGGNVIGNPDFKEGSHQLELLSPGIGQGIETATINGQVLEAPGRDYSGSPRPDPVDGRVDMGALESPYAAYVHIPDPDFREALADMGMEVFNEGYISLNDAESLRTLDVGKEDYGISDLTGLGAFVNLDTLICSGNAIKALDLSAHTGLSYLDCSENPIAKLDLSEMLALVHLDLSDMPELGSVCVWTFPFPPEGVLVDTTGSPDLSFTDDCFRNQPPEVIAAEFGEFNLISETLYMPARLFTPEDMLPGESYPVVITLHGAGEVGADNYSHILYNHLATSWAAYEWQMEHPCFVFSPQVIPAFGSWNSDEAHGAFMILLDSLIQNYPVDTSRIYITGLSLGGNGTWEYLARDPDLYAAAIPVCGGYWNDNQQGIYDKVEKIKHIPVWNFHGNKDDVVMVQQSRSIMERYMEHGEFPLFTHNFYRQQYSLTSNDIQEYTLEHAELIYSEVPNIGHNVWNVAYQFPLAKQWLFKQRRHGAGHIQVLSAPGDALQKSMDARIPVSGDLEFSVQVSDQCSSVSLWVGQEHSADWEFVETIDPGTGSYTFDSRKVNDHAFARLRFLAHDKEGHVIGRDYSEHMRIDNAGNGSPYVRIVDDYFLIRSGINKAVHPMTLLVGDPESDSLLISMEVSYDRGVSFEHVDDWMAPEGEEFLVGVPLVDLYRSSQTVILLEASDGEKQYATQTLYFDNQKGMVVSAAYSDEGSFRIYPNPVSGLLKITTEKADWYHMEVSSLKGELLLENRFFGERHQADLSFLAPGIYFITLRSSGVTATRKIIKH